MGRPWPLFREPALNGRIGFSLCVCLFFLCVRPTGRRENQQNGGSLFVSKSNNGGYRPVVSLGRRRCPCTPKRSRFFFFRFRCSFDFFFFFFLSFFGSLLAEAAKQKTTPIEIDSDGAGLPGLNFTEFFFVVSLCYAASVALFNGLVVLNAIKKCCLGLIGLGPAVVAGLSCWIGSR